VGDVAGATNLLERALALPGLTEDFRRELELRLSIALVERGDQARAEDLLTERLESERRERSYLLYRDETGRQRTLDLDTAASPITIGRRAATDLPLPWDEEVSRLHAHLENDDEGWGLVDAGSRNGSFVNGERVIDRRLLRDGDALRVGHSVVLFRAPVERSAATQQPAESALTALGGEIISARDVTPDESLLLRTLVTSTQRGADVTLEVALELVAPELHRPPSEVEVLFMSLTGKFGTSDLPERIKIARTLDRARAIGAI